MPDVAGFVLRAVTGLIESTKVGASLCIPDGSGRLRTVAVRGVPIRAGDRSRSTNRRRALRTGSTVTMASTDARAGLLEMIPLIDEDAPVGVLEVQAPSEALEASREPLLMIASQAARILRRTHDRAPEMPTADATARTFELANELLRSESPREALRATVDCLHDALHLPVAGWISSMEGAPFELGSCAGMTRAERAELTAADVRTLGGLPARVVRTGRVVLAVGGVSGPTPPLVEGAGPLLTEVLRRTEILDRAKRRNDALDTGLAWTAHELRRSLEGIRLAVEAARSADDQGREGGRLLRMAARELDRLTADVESVLRWATGGRGIRRRQTDLMRLVREVAKATAATGAGRVVIDGPDELMIPADGANLRTAIANLVRNAISYTDNDSPAVVRIEPSDGWVLVSVSDEGPGIPTDERESIFDPFVRGRTARGQTGNGLGLFIARRVAEAHGGGLWCESGRGGATFVLRLPRAVGGRSSPAS